MARQARPKSVFFSLGEFGATYYRIAMTTEEENSVVSGSEVL
jgi:hypothetical protein